jgi:hypothetical protein
MIKAPESHTNSIASVLSEVQFLEKGKWNNFKIIFDTGNKDEAKFVSVFVLKKEAANNQKYDFVYLDFLLNFKLSPDTLIIMKSCLIEDKKWSEDERTLSYKGSDLAWRDLNLMFKYFWIVGYKSLPNYFNVSFDLDQ